MSDKLLEKYFEELRKEIGNEDYIKELKESIETISREEIVELIKKHY
ncbi:MAG: hypothetical protein IKV87_09065 [Methanobrevibacter sp.]|nr:hypothetical protein [Methanobrevibacter sp.]